MRRSLSLFALGLGASLAISSPAQAQEIGRGRNFGLGVVAGYPGFGFSMNIFLNQRMSLQIDPLLFSSRGDLWAGARADLLFYPGRPIVNHRVYDLRWYLGPGLALAMNLSEAGLALVPEVPVGIGLQFKRVPIDLMLEAVPQFWLRVGDNGRHDRLHVWVAVAIHARYYF